VHNFKSENNVKNFSNILSRAKITKERKLDTGILADEYFKELISSERNTSLTKELCNTYRKILLSFGWQFKLRFLIPETYIMKKTCFIVGFRPPTFTI
jgi:hypothetical protein